MQTTAESDDDGEQTGIDMSEAFELARLPDTLQEAIDDPEVETGRSGLGIVKIGSFGGGGYTDDPDEIEFTDKHARGFTTARKARRIAAKTDFKGRLFFPTLADEPQYSRSDLDNPFTTYRFHFYVAPNENGYLSPNELFEGIVDRFQTELSEGKTNIRAVEFECDDYTLGERYRAVYPWGKYGKHTPDDTEIDLPKPIQRSIRTLQKHPKLPEYYTVTGYIHAYNTKYDGYNSVDDTFKSEFFYTGSNHTYVLDTSESTPARKHLNSTQFTTFNERMSYSAELTIDAEDVGEAIESNDAPHYINNARDYARWLGREQHAEEYGGKPTDVSVGIEQEKETEDGYEFRLTIVA